jgi:hypothetical protein
MGGTLGYVNGTVYTSAMVTAKLDSPIALQANDVIIIKFTHEIAV